MKTLPVKVTEEGVVIPKEYLKQADAFEAVVQNGDILVRPKSDLITSDNQTQLLPSESTRYSFVGIARSKNPNASADVEEILQKELGLNLEQADEE